MKANSGYSGLQDSSFSLTGGDNERPCLLTFAKRRATGFSREGSGVLRGWSSGSGCDKVSWDQWIDQWIHITPKK